MNAEAWWGAAFVVLILGGGFFSGLFETDAPPASRHPDSVEFQAWQVRDAKRWQKTKIMAAAIIALIVAWVVWGR